MNIHEIYSHLLSGKTLELPFRSAEEAEKFRIKLSLYKLRQDRGMIDVGMIKDTERQKLSFEVQTQLPPGPPFLATIMFKDRDTLQQYEVKILDEPSELFGSMELK